MKLFPSLQTCTCMALAVAVLAGCSSAQQQAAVPVTIDLSVCILETLVPDVMAGKVWQTCVDDTIHACGADAAAIAKIWAAYVKAEVRAGHVPPRVAGTDGGAP